MLVHATCKLFVIPLRLVKKEVRWIIHRVGKVVVCDKKTGDFGIDALSTTSYEKQLTRILFKKLARDHFSATNNEHSDLQRWRVFLKVLQLALQRFFFFSDDKPSEPDGEGEVETASTFGIDARLAVLSALFTTNIPIETSTVGSLTSTFAIFFFARLLVPKNWTSAA